MKCFCLFVLLVLPVAHLFAQEDCDVFNIQDLSAAYLNFSVDSIILQPDGSHEVHLSNGTTYTMVLGCMDPAYFEYDAAANTDDGSCATPPCESPTMDGYSYSVVRIGDQCWFAENLRTTTYADGTAIPAGLTYGEWGSTTSGATAVYGEDGGGGCDNYSPDIDACDEAQSLAEYGRLYNWYAVNNGSGLCPSGWHVPTDGEWMVLEMELGMSGSEANLTGYRGTDEGTALKSTYGWSYSGNGTDDFEFSALPGGFRSDFGNFYYAGYDGYWWSSSPSGGSAWSRYLFDFSPVVLRYYDDPRNGFSVRCLRDADFSSIQGCTDPAADNYDATANTDDDSCIFSGCTDSAYVEYDAAANTDDGSCATLVVNGCTDPAADNYDATANTDDDSCIFSGCTDPAYVEYDAAANADDGSCATLVVNGCTDPAYVEYDAAANTDDGSCTTLVVNGCTDPAYVEYDAAANADDGSCATLVVNGCTDPAYVEYDAAANTDDGSCSNLLGCTDPVYLEYDAAANTDDGSCVTLVVNGCTDSVYLEYDAAANTDDGSCATLIDPNCVDVAMDGHTYSVVQIGDQCWFAENLRTTVYADDSAIPEVTDGSAWGSGYVTGARCDYENHAFNVTSYGRLYNLYAVYDARGLCPSGWHVPTDGEWTDLEDFITSQGFSGTEGTALKATAGWYGYSGNGTDDFGFSALPGGYRSHTGNFFDEAGDDGFWWSSSPVGPSGAWSRKLSYTNPVVYRDYYTPRSGRSVRCLRDAD